SALRPPEAPMAPLDTDHQPAAAPAAPSIPKPVPIPRRRRSATLSDLAGLMHRRGVSAQAIALTLLAENVARCHPPLPKSEVIALVRAAVRTPPDSPPPDTANHSELGTR